MDTPGDNRRVCPNCGDRLGAGAPLGLCPRCLLAQYLTPTDGLASAPSDAAGPSASPDSPSETGSTFGDYDLLEEIGRGGMGVVYRARQRGLDRVVALKMIIPSRLTSAKDLQRFRLEAETAARLEHPHILPIYEVGEISGQPYYTTKYLEGGNLAQKTATMRTGFGSKTTDHTDHDDKGRLLGLFLKVCQAVAYAHARGVLHRDLKPANILLDRAGEPYVADFGLARFLEKESDLTLSQAMVGTPAYAAPEQLREGTRHLTTAADVYSLGTVLYELLTGRPPLRGPTTAETVRQVLDEEAKPLRALNPAVDRDLEAICRKCLEKDPRQRYANAGALAQELEHYLAGEPIQARPLDTVALAWRWCRRRPAVAGLIGAIAAAVLVVAVVSTIAVVRIAASRRMQERENYYALINLAQSLVEQGEIDQAKEALLKCPPRFRYWEWGHLLFRCHQDVLSIPAHTEIKFDARLLEMSSVALVQKVAFNHDTSQLASLGRDGAVKVWDAKDGHRLFALGDTNRPATAIAFNPSSQQFAAVFSDGAAKVWDAGHWQKRWDFRFETGKVEQVTYRPDGKRLAWWGRTEVRVCDAATGATIGRQRSDAPIISVTFVSGGSRLLVRTEREGRVFDTDGKTDLGALALPAVSGGALFISPTADRFVIVSSTGTVSLWSNSNGKRAVEKPAMGSTGDPPVPSGDSPDGTGSGPQTKRQADSTVVPARIPVGGSPTGAGESPALPHHQADVKIELGEIRGAQPGLVRQVFFSKDGQRFCTGGESSTARVWDTESGKELLAIPVKVYQAVFSPDGSRLITSGSEKIARVWDLEQRSELLQLRGHSARIETIAFSPDGSRLATGAQDGTVKLWSAALGRDVLQQPSWVWGLALSPDGHRIVAGWGPEFTVWDAESGQRLVTVDSRVHDVMASAFSPDGQRMVTAGSDSLARVWDASTGRLLLNLEGHTREVRSVAWAPSGSWIASGSPDGTARIWEASTGRQVHCLDHGSNLVCHVAFSPDSRRLATAGEQGLRMWDVASGRLLFKVSSQGTGLYRVVFSPDGRHLVLIDNLAWSIQVCDARTGKAVATWPSGVALKAAFSGDGHRFLVVASGWDASYGMGEVSAQLWDFESGRRVLTLKGHSEPFNEVAFAANDRRIVSSSFDMTVRQWETFPWRDAEYPGTPDQPLLERARRFADEYWRKRLVAEAGRVEPIRSRPDHTTFWPRRDALAAPAQLDLTDHYNGLLHDALLPVFSLPDRDNCLRELGSGLLELGGVRFDVRGMVQLRRHTLFERASEVLWERLPVQVEGILVQRKIQRLQVLHGTANTESWQKDGTEVARLLWHYDSGQEASPILYGQDVRDWWWRPEDAVEPTSERSRVVWTGSNPCARQKGYQLRLCLTTIENPRPEETVRSLDYVSAMSESAPFLIALTVE